MSKNQKKQVKLRPSIVAVLGHVDHGKTTLLDAIRQTKIVEKEAGGITQSIGASVVETKNKEKITFIDTPGHAAFSAMRSRGANAADIAILVVAADEGVKPQTKEAYKHILNAEIPYIVVAAKMDIAGASKETVQGQLEKEGVLFEGRGGDVPLVGVSAKTKSGIDDLLEMIVLVAEVNEITGSEKDDLEAVVIETQKDKVGPRASVVVKNGSIAVGQQIYSVGTEAKVRGLFDHKGKSVRKVTCGLPVQILGFSDLPPIGARVLSVKGDTKSFKKTKEAKIVKKDNPGLSIVVKAKNTGSLEAIKTNLPNEINIVSSGVGEVTETDVFMAKSSSPSLILAFESKVSNSIKKLAESEEVEIETFDVIYKLFDRVEEIIDQGRVKILGRAKIVDTFPFDNKKVAGCKVIKGQFNLKDTVIVKRNKKDLGEARVDSIRKHKDKVSSVKEGEECGIVFTPQLEFDKGDMLVSVRKP
jgi:translation initiation factor IF-2